MKICHIIYIPRLSGAEILVRDLAIYHGTEGNQIIVLSLEPSEDSFSPISQAMQASNVGLVFPDRKLGKLSRLKFLNQSLRDFEPDVIIAHSIIPSVYVRLALRLLGSASVPVVTVLHDASQDDYASPYFRSIERFLKPSGSVIALTDHALSNYRKRCGKKSKVSIIPNGINLSALRVDFLRREEVRSRIFAVNQTEPVFLQVGRMNRNKQQHLSIKAFIQTCKDEAFNGKLFLAGLVQDKEYCSELRQMVADAGLQERIIFLGPRSDIPDLLAASDVYLMPSLVEAHSIAFLEALANGITMVISDIPAFERGKQFSGVFSLQPEDTQTFAKILAELAKQNSIQRWQRDLSEFSIDKTANSYLEVFDSLLTI